MRLDDRIGLVFELREMLRLKRHRQRKVLLSESIYKLLMLLDVLLKHILRPHGKYPDAPVVPRLAEDELPYPHQPGGLEEDGVHIIISIIAKSAALFAFLALMTGFGLSLFGESATVGGLDALFEKLDSITLGTATEEMEEQVNNEINDAIYLFSPIFVTMVFALIYFYKLVQQTSSDLVNKFFPDNTFGDSSPMHSTATMMTDYTRKMVTSITGANLAKDIVANQAGIGIKKLMQGTGRAIRHPQQTARNIASKFKSKSSGSGK